MVEQIRWIARCLFRTAAPSGPRCRWPGLPVRAERHRDDKVGVAGQRLAQGRGVGRVRDVPQSDGVVLAAGGEGVPVRAEGRRGDGVGVAGQRLTQRRGVGWVRHIPQPHSLVAAATGQDAPIRTNATEPTVLVWAGSDTFHNRTVWSPPLAKMRVACQNSLQV